MYTDYIIFLILFGMLYKVHNYGIVFKHRNLCYKACLNVVKYVNVVMLEYSY